MRKIFLAVMIISSLVFADCNSALLQTDADQTDRVSLLAFKAETNDPFGALSSWNDSKHFCKWSYVRCERQNQRVIELDLSSCRLAGHLSPHIGNLSLLKKLDLENNSFSNSIPQQLGRLRQLETLNLANNSFSGQVPSNISNCSSLRCLWLGDNNLSGKLPSQLGLLPKLVVLSFRNNTIAGEIPPSLGNISSLRALYGEKNSLTGVIPGSVGKLTKLTLFSFGENNLSGFIPPLLYNASSLDILYLSFNQLEGTLPPDLGLLLPNLGFLAIAGNKFSGMIPPTLSNASRLRGIELGSNDFHGKVPYLIGLNDLVWVLFYDNHLGNSEDDDLNFLSSLVNCSRLELLEIDDNRFGGLFPEYVSNFSTSLGYALFGRNRIWGSIPSGIGNLIGLQRLDLESNQLTGVIPSFQSKLPKLKELFLQDNKISGSIPSSIGNLTSLLQIDLGSNNLQGNIPTSLVNLRYLLVLNLSENELTGTIPRELMALSSLSKGLFLSNNQLNGSIPVEVGKLENLGHLDLSNNKLSGEIPEALGRCSSLESLKLEGNLLQGTIPKSLSSLRAVQSIDLSCNRFSGSLPDFLGDLKLLRNLNLSFNDFEGEVLDQGVFRNASAVSLLGNEKLCSRTSVLNLPRCTPSESKRKKSSTKLKKALAISSGLLLLGVIMMFLFIAICMMRTRRNRAVLVYLPDISLPRMTYGDLFKATDGFSSNNLIGTGGFGSVYQGIVQLGEAEITVVAVKVLNLQHKGALESFFSECEALRSIKHRNLVRTLTVCSSTDFSGNDFKALIYQYMENRSLEEWLRPAEQQYASHDQPQYLNLTQRLSIAIDVAHAVDYLHNQCPQPIVHRDLKPSNILLDGDMTACIGDFGLARLIPEPSNQLISNHASSSGFKGSIGYAAPEHAMGDKVSTEGDIYSYGILLLEMLTGKKPTDGIFKEGLNLHDFVNDAFPHGLSSVVDPILFQEIERYRNDRRNRIRECLVSMLRIGLSCSAETPRNRMTVTDVVAQLRLIRDNYLRART